MISRNLKATYYLLMRIPMRINGVLFRIFRAPRKGFVKVHLGPGQKSYIDGWINVDANFVSAKIDLWANLLDPLPFPDNSVDVFYSHHVIEHFPDMHLATHFAELFRCLKPGGVIRVGGPNGDVAARKLVEGDKAWFGSWPDDRKSVGGRFVNYIFLRGEHLTMLTESYLRELCTDAGFSAIVPRLAGKETGHAHIFNASVLALEGEPETEAPHTIIIEAEKPKASANGTRV